MPRDVEENVNTEEVSEELPEEPVPDIMDVTREALLEKFFADTASL